MLRRDLEQDCFPFRILCILCCKDVLSKTYVVSLDVNKRARQSLSCGSSGLSLLKDLYHVKC